MKKQIIEMARNRKTYKNTSGVKAFLTLILLLLVPCCPWSLQPLVTVSSDDLPSLSLACASIFFSFLNFFKLI